RPLGATILIRPKWRNWQTRRTQNPVPLGACGFDSHLRHPGATRARMIRAGGRWRSGAANRLKRHGLRRSWVDLAVLGGYAAIAFAFFGWRLLPHPGRSVLGFGHDAQIFVWSFA